MSDTGDMSDVSDIKFGSWSVTESPVSVEYSLVVIEEIRQEVAEGFQKLSRGGLEVGGILYGTREGRTVRIMAMRPVKCEHARGPGFMLSDNDKAGLSAQLASEDQRLEGLIPVGWFLSHTRSEITLTDSDIELYSTYFPAPWQITLVIRPGRGGSMRAGFFVREADGTVRHEHSYLEFNFPDRLEGVLDRPARVERPITERRESYTHAAPPAAVPVREPEPEPERERERERPPTPSSESPKFPYQSPEFLPASPPRKKWPWVALILVVLAALAVVGLRYYMPGVAAEPIALSVLERDGQLLIEWNHNAKSVVNATRGALEVVDGAESKRFDLTPTDLTRGKFTWQRKTGEVEVRLSVQSTDGGKTQEASRYLGRAPQKADNGELQAIQLKRDELEAEVARLRSANVKQTERIQQLERTLRILQARLGIETGKQ